MPAERAETVKKLMHDVNSKCASLKSAAGLLRESPPAEARELLRLMAEQARALALIIEDFSRRLGS